MALVRSFDWAPVSDPGKIEFYTKTGFLIIQVEIEEVWGCPGGAHGAYATFLLELWQDLVLYGTRKSTFQHLTVNWNFNVLEMVFKTLHFVQGLSRTPLLFIPRYYTNICFENILQKENYRESKI